MLGLKLEDRACIDTAHASASVPGIAFAEWGPGDMGMSFGYPDAHDPPYPPEIEQARHAVKAACDAAGLHFLSAWNEQCHRQVRRCALGSPDARVPALRRPCCGDLRKAHYPLGPAHGRPGGIVCIEPSRTHR